MLRFPRNHSTAGTYRGMPPQNFETNKHEIVRFRGIFAVKRKKPINMIISSFNCECELLGILNELDKNKQLSIQCCVMFGHSSRRWSNNNINQPLGHPLCDNIYATLFVECRLCNYVGPNYATIIY